MRRRCCPSSVRPRPWWRAEPCSSRLPPCSTSKTSMPRSGSSNAAERSSSGWPGHDSRNPYEVARMKIAILDDYQNVASGLADWDSLAAEVVVFTKAFADGDDAVRSLPGFDVLVAMREPTRFSAEVLERLTGLRLLVSTGPRQGLQSG